MTDAALSGEPVGPGRRGTAAPGGTAWPRGSRGSRLALSRLLTAIESRTAAAEEALRTLYPGGRQRPRRGHHRAPGRRQVHARGGARRGGPCRAAGPWPCWPSIPPAPSPAAPSWATASACSSTPGTATSSSARWPRAATSAGWPARRPNRLRRSRPAASASSSSRPWAPGQSEVEVAAIADTTVVVQAPEMGDEVQALKAGLLEVADIVVVNKSDRPGADRAAAQLRAVLTLGCRAGTASRGPRRQPAMTPARPAPPEASPGAAGLGPDRAPACRSCSLRSTSITPVGSPRHGPHAARLARARAQVEGILADRVREALWSSARRASADALLEQVAAHELDPYTAADRLLDDIAQRIRVRRMTAAIDQVPPRSGWFGGDEPADRERSGPLDPDAVSPRGCHRRRNAASWRAAPCRRG